MPIQSFGLLKLPLPVQDPGQGRHICSHVRMFWPEGLLANSHSLPGPALAPSVAAAGMLQATEVMIEGSHIRVGRAEDALRDRQSAPIEPSGGGELARI